VSTSVVFLSRINATNRITTDSHDSITSWIGSKAGYGGLTAKLARDEAIQLQARVASGDDPGAEREGHRKALTVAELCDQWLEAGHNYKRENTLKNNRSQIETHIKPLLGTKPVAALTRADVEKFYRDVAAGKTARKGRAFKDHKAAAAVALGTLRAILSRAVDNGLIEKNTAHGVKSAPTPARKIPFSFKAVSSVGKAMRDAEHDGVNKTALNALRVLLLTGLRKNEALSLQWGAVDFDARCVRLKESKTGPQVRPLGRAALDLLKGLKPRGAKPADFVFPAPQNNPSKRGHITDTTSTTWAVVRTRAKIDSVPIHGLRHWFASAAAELGYSDLTIAGLVGHKIATMTARYANAPDSAFITAADRISQVLADALDGKDANEKVVSISGRAL
jgi:integrase